MPAARADTTVRDGQMLVAVGRSRDQATAMPTLLSDRRVRVILDYPGNPLFDGQNANDIAYEITITIDFVNMTHQLTGNHDGFPSYEIYVNQQRIHHHSHGLYGPWALDPGREINFDHPPAEIQR